MSILTTAQFSDFQSLEKGFPIHGKTLLNSEVCFIRAGIDQFIQRFVFFHISSSLCITLENVRCINLYCSTTHARGGIWIERQQK
ncbi:hypothetical protein Theba_1125 [Mesotoga prima MesG1.Ag.4.2]|uniref:Uncharacterized protein n=1 Tax=Mesotoga prima MesG1.Ag.4.2 TaxID=660470 RepID=I2F4H6_9BACT|nr:hypothetical protein Theba_1125 [Mesotoga prima MesG1.Ag.4.2]